MFRPMKAIVKYCNERQLKRFMPWKIHLCNYCYYPLSEKVVEETTINGKKKQVYCCDLCYELRENKIIPSNIKW